MATTATRRPRGSEAMLADRGIGSEQLQQLLKVARSGGDLAYWYPKGQPVPDAVLGVVRTRPGKAGALIDRILGIEGLGLRVDVFPLGTPKPEEIIVSFEQGFGGR